MPGVQITTVASGAQSAALSAASGQFFVVGLAERGNSTEAVLVRGLADFEALFGARTTYSMLYDTIKVFFEEGGEQAYVARVVGEDATEGFVSVNDTATPSPVPTVQFTATSAGAYSSGLVVRVADGALPDTKKITVLFDGSPVEVRNNLATPAAIVAAFSASSFVNAVDLASATAAPDNLPANGDFTLSAGTDDRAAVLAADYIAALDRFGEGLGDGAVAIPGLGSTVHDGLIAHVEANNRIALLSLDVDSDAAETSLAALALNSDAAGLFTPWVEISDNAGGRRAISPEGYVAGVRARAHSQVGAWRPPAGGIAESVSILGLVTNYSTDEANSLDADKVSVIRKISNTYRLYGWRSLSIDQANFGYLNARDLLNRIVVESGARLEQYVFAPVDARGQTLAAINAELVGILEPIRQAGGLYERTTDDGQQIDNGYLVETGSSVNTAESLANNIIRARVSIRVSPIGALISLTIVKVGLLSGLS